MDNVKDHDWSNAKWRIFLSSFRNMENFGQLAENSVLEKNPDRSPIAKTMLDFQTERFSNWYFKNDCSYHMYYILYVKWYNSVVFKFVCRVQNHRILFFKYLHYSQMYLVPLGVIPHPLLCLPPTPHLGNH